MKSSAQFEIDYFGKPVTELTEGEAQACYLKAWRLSDIEQLRMLGWPDRKFGLRAEDH